MALNIDVTKYRLPAGQFFAEQHPKDMIMLHFTAGSTVSGAVSSWTSQNIQIGTPYILDKDGTIYQTFDPKCWAYHLGVVGPKAQNHKHDKRSVPIEIINMGPLKLKMDTLYSWPNNYGQKFCRLNETSKYVKVSYRGFDYYEAFTISQKTALVELVKKISTDFNIPVTLPPAGKREEFDLDFYDTWKGVASHQNFRSDKFDIGPAWDWSLLS
jgi:N-acetyl-anhydromuramyl-L-alanine amidase AmpD